MTTINESTSVIAVKTSQLVAGQSTIVYVSSTSDVGQLVSVFDIQGFLSAPQSILVSSVSGVDLGPGLSSIRVQQRFGYVTLRSVSNTSWSIVDENAFRSPSLDYALQGIQYGQLNALEVIVSKMSTTVCAASSIVTTSAALLGPLFVSSIGISADVSLVNSLSNSSNYVVQSSLSTVTASFLSTVSSVGPVSVQNNLAVGGALTARSTMFLQSSLTTTMRILANSNMTVQGQVTVGSNVQCFANASTTAVVATQVSVRTFGTNNILFDSAAQLFSGPAASLYVSSSLYVPNTIQASTLNVDNLSTRTLTVLSSIFAPAISISNAAIRNTGGSLSISSVQANSIQYTTLYGSNATSTVKAISTQTGLFSTLLLDDGLYVQNTIEVGTGYINSLFSDKMFINEIVSGGGQGLNLDTVSISTITISNVFLAPQMSSMTMTAVAMTSPQIIGNDARAPIVFASTLSGVVTINDTGLLFMSTPGLSTAVVAATYISSAIGITSSLTMSNAVLGPVLNPDPTAPYFVPSTFSGLSPTTPSEYIRGIGAPFSPFHVVVSGDSDVAAYISNGSGTAYLNMNYFYNTTGPSTPGTASIILRNPIVQSTLVTLSSTAFTGYQTFSLSNYQIDTTVVSTMYTNSLIGPMTYATLSQPQQTLIAGGVPPTVPQFAYSSDGGSNWATLPFVGFETATYGIAFGDTKWVAVGDGLTNTMLFSYTGTTWYDIGKSIFYVRGNGVAWNGSIWVALGEGTNTLATSYDGITWSIISSVFTVRGLCAAANGSQWIAGGSGTNTLARSTDGGATWVGQGTSVFSVATYGIAWNGSLWVAVGSGTNTLATSPNGITWTGRGTSVFQTEGRAIAWNGSYWLAGSASDTAAQIAYSTDGLNWTKVLCPLTSVYTLAWTGLNWLAGGAGTSATATSPDGLVWTAASIPYTTVYAIASRAPPYAPVVPSPLYVIGGQGTNLLATSTDGSTWTPRTVPFTASVKCVAWNGSLWVAGGAGTFVIATSPDGIVWTGIPVANMTAVLGIAWGKPATPFEKGRWIGVGTGTGGYTRVESVDGITWTPYVYTTGNFFAGAGDGIVWAQGLWIATGTPNGSGILFSLNGIDWIPQIATMFTVGQCVTSNGTLFLAGGSGTSKMAYSLAGSVWAPVTSCPMTTQVNEIAWGQGVWVAVGQGTHTIAYSYDGITWIGLGTAIFSVSGLGITWTGSGWIATGQGTNTLATSSDGITWQGQGSAVFTVSGIAAAAAPIILPNTSVPREEPIGIRWTYSGVAILSPSVIEKPPRTNPGYDSYARSQDGYAADAFLQFRPESLDGSAFIGLTTSAIPLSPLAYAFALTDTGNLEIWEGGIRAAALGPFAISDTFQIVFDGTKISYQKNSVEVRAVSRIPGLPLFLEVQINLGGTRIRSLEFHPLNRIANYGAAIPSQFLTTIQPSGFLSQPISFSRPIVETTFPPSLWEFAIPIAGTLVAPSTQIYASVFISSLFQFSTSVLQFPITTVPSTYTLRYTLSTPIATTPGDALTVSLYTQRSRGTTSLYSTTLTTSIYNLSSTQYVELVHNTGSANGAQTSELSLWIQSGTAAFGRYVNSNAGIEMNRGLLRWNERQYGLSIQNQYNDLQTRSLTYTGGLFTASDSNLKHGITYADTADLYKAIETLPLHRYTLIGSWRDRFSTEDANQLGVLTTEVAAQFPSMIKTVDSEFIPDLQTVDRAQLRYAHLGATQHLMGRLSTLRSRIERIV